MERLTGPLADVLRRGRSAFNAKFAAASNADVPIDAQGFQHYLAGTLDPIVRSVSAEFAERTETVAVALFDLSLELFGRNLLGPSAKYPAIDAAWRKLLPRMPLLMAREPAQVAGAVTNALYNLSRTPGARPQEWTARMTGIAAACQNANDLLVCGSILAWRCGMPQYRQSALEKIGLLPPELTTRVLDLAPDTAPEQLPEVIRSLQLNPWILPQDALSGYKTRGELKMVGKAGAFRGFAGQFLAPPVVACVNGELIAFDGEVAWRLYADIHNSLLLRCEPGPRNANGDVQKLWQVHIQRFPELANATSIAAVVHTVAVTLPTSHQLFLLGFL
jgi:hypothetical protein